MAFKLKVDQLSMDRDEEVECSDMWKRTPARVSRIEDKAKDDKETLPDIVFNSPPQSMLPSINPLLALKETDEDKKMAAVEIILKKIRAKGYEMGSIRDWQTIKDQKQQLQELFTTAEKGINENRASIARFYEIIKENSKDKQELERELELTRQRIEDYREVQQEFTHYVNKYCIFERFLEDVASSEESWRNVRDVLNRYETLQSTSSECARILENELEQSAELRKRMMTVVEDKSNQMKSLSNKLVVLEVQQKDARERRVHWEHMVQKIKYTTLDETINANTLKEGIKDLYQSMCSRHRVVPSIPVSDVEGQIDFIHKTILFYKEVVPIAMGLH